jgi:hypothetical protein
VECGHRPPESIDTGRPLEDLRQKVHRYIATSVHRYISTSPHPDNPKTAVYDRKDALPAPNYPKESLKWPPILDKNHRFRVIHKEIFDFLFRN